MYFFWAGCESDRKGEACDSKWFNSSDCYKNWEEDWNSGFVIGGELQDHYQQAVQYALEYYYFNATRAVSTIVIGWAADPVQEGSIFWSLGVFAVCAAPFVYAISGVLYSVFCKSRLTSSF